MGWILYGVAVLVATVFACCLGTVAKRADEDMERLARAKGWVK